MINCDRTCINIFNIQRQRGDPAMGLVQVHGVAAEDGLDGGQPVVRSTTAHHQVPPLHRPISRHPRRQRPF